jgi:predicted O-methyltransferase YrrM
MHDFYSSPMKVAADGRTFYLDHTSIRPAEAMALRQLVVDAGATHTLEIGLALGASAVVIAEALEEKGGESRHVVLDPYQRAFGFVGLGELERLKLKDRVEFHAECSEEFFPGALKAGRRFDLVFDDGSRSIGQKVTNTFFADRCLNTGGILAFHDAFLPATVASVQYLIKERSYELISLPPDSQWKRLARMLKWGAVHGWWFGLQVVPFACRSLVAVRKTPKSAE